MSDEDDPDATGPDEVPATPAPPLHYLPPRYDYERLQSEQNARLGGVVLSTLSIVGLVFLCFLCSMNGYPKSPPASVQFGIPIGCAAAVAAVLGLVAWRQWVTRRSRAFALGLLIGVGVAALIEGACFAILRP
jgi:hypothetical protein